ncbi:unnamed protein product [Malus baccata var. baccata]
MVEGLQRLEITFRRQGSSMLICEDNSGRREIQHGRTHHGAESINRRNELSDGQGLAQAMNSPSPKVSKCGICNAFGKPKPSSMRRPRPNKQGFAVDFAMFKKD